MTTDEVVAAGFRAIETALDGSPPDRLLSAIRDEAPKIRLRRTARTRQRIGVGSGLLALLVAGAFTSPGRAATEWVADLTGIGDEPTLDHPFDEPGAVVIDTGRLSDGTSYEIVARIIDPASRFGDTRNRGFAPDPSEVPTRIHGVAAGPMICFGLDLPTDPKADQDSLCAGDHATPNERFPVTNFGAFPEGRLRSDPAVLLGMVEDPEIAEVRVVDGLAQTEPVIPSKLLSVDQALLDAARRVDPIWFFVSPVDERVVDAVQRGDLELYAVALDEEGRELSRIPAMAREPVTNEGADRRPPLDRDRARIEAQGGNPGDPVPVDPQELQPAGG